jgi:hypothetical protein
LPMNDLGIDATNTVLCGDNTSCISVCKDAESSDRTRHFDGQCKKIQEIVKINVISANGFPQSPRLQTAQSSSLVDRILRRRVWSLELWTSRKTGDVEARRVFYLLAHPYDVVKPRARFPQPVFAGVCCDVECCASACSRAFASCSTAWCSTVGRVRTRLNES